MAALEADTEGAKGDAGSSWALPDWEEYSDRASSSFAGDWSDVEADVSLDTASSVASTEHQRVYRIQRARGELKDVHSLYTRRRMEESSQGLSSVRSSANWPRPTPCASPRVPEEKPRTPVTLQQGDKQVGRELLAQQSEISAELQAVRRQLSEFQDKWKKTVEGRADAESSGAPTVASSWSSPLLRDRGRKVIGKAVAVQTESEEREDAVKQWILLLTQKLETLTRRYSHEPTYNFQTAMTHLDGLQRSDDGDTGKTNESASNNEEVDDASSPSSWHVGRALKMAVPLEIAEQFLELEHAVACMSAAVEQHERRQMTNFDRAMQQVQGYHHERMQRVVDESLAELKTVRGRYKKKEAQLEDELRTATKEIEQWKKTVAEAEHRKKLDRETLEFQISSAKEQYKQACRRYEGEVAQLNTQLETTAYESGEERFSLSKVQNLLDNEADRLTKFEKWNTNGVTYDSLKKKLDLSQSDMVRLRNLYHDYLGL
ncbi:avirulence protein 1b [Phytophthora cinnamomi]|uniref:avirulence protein 1b n=1 Tax=Phytophthora cinnamomi TaxID=4785 RepID=UPI00355A5409|nr:avirulence protein 1b [Phytophthora cinnamomi]